MFNEQVEKEALGYCKISAIGAADLPSTPTITPATLPSSHLLPTLNACHPHPHICQSTFPVEVQRATFIALCG